MSTKSSAFNNSVEKEMKSLGLYSILFSSIFACMTILYIYTYETGVLSSITGNFIGGGLGIYMVLNYTYKAHPRLSKIKTEMNKIYNNYKNQSLAYMISIIYLFFVTSIILLNYSDSSLFMITDLIAVILLTTMTSSLLFLGTGYTTAWLNYKKN